MNYSYYSKVDKYCLRQLKQTNIFLTLDWESVKFSGSVESLSTKLWRERFILCSISVIGLSSNSVRNNTVLDLVFNKVL